MMSRAVRPVRSVAAERVRPEGKSTAGPGRRAELVEQVITIAAERGLDAVSVREVATAAAVAIGTVQYHFGSKDAMLEAAFERVVEGTRERIAGQPFTGDARIDLTRALRELLPLDDERRREAKAYLAFAARAATSPALARRQGELLTALRSEIGTALGAGRRARAIPLLATVDGLMLHAVSAPEDTSVRQLTAAVQYAVDAALA